MMSVTAGANKSAFSFSNQVGIMSGPEDLAGFSTESFFRTRNSETDGGLEWRASTVLRGPGGVNVLIGSRKASFTVSARAVGLELGPG